MHKKILISIFSMLTMMSAFLTAPAAIKVEPALARANAVRSAKGLQRRFGPYATLRRANEVANYARRLGYQAKIIYGGSLYYGTREYYVDVWR